MPQFANPHHERRKNDDNCPVLPLHGDNVEEFVEHFNDENLSDDDGHHDALKAVAAFQVQSAAAGLVGTGIEHVPEMSPHEDGEQQGLFVRCDGVLHAERCVG